MTIDTFTLCKLSFLCFIDEERSLFLYLVFYRYTSFPFVGNLRYAPIHSMHCGMYVCMADVTLGSQFARSLSVRFFFYHGAVCGMFKDLVDMRAGKLAPDVSNFWGEFFRGGISCLGSFTYVLKANDGLVIFFERDFKVVKNRMDRIFGIFDSWMRLSASL